MKLNVDKEACKKNNTTLGEFFLLMLYYYGENKEVELNNLIKKGCLTSFGTTNEYRVTSTGVELINSVIADSNVSKSDDEEIKELAKRLREVYPKGKKPGTPYYWADSTQIIEKRLKLFFKKYNITDFDSDAIVTAVQKYVDSFNNDYRFMKLLKYFIFKEDIKTGEVESQSELLNYLENSSQDIDTFREDSFDELRV